MDQKKKINQLRKRRQPISLRMMKNHPKRMIRVKLVVAARIQMKDHAR